MLVLAVTVSDRVQWRRRLCAAGQHQEVLLHETAVAWVRHREKTVRPVRPWEETPAQYATRLRSIFQDINDNLDVEGLCWSLPERLQALVDAEGDRIPSHLSE